MKYVRERGKKYTVVNPNSRPNGLGGMDVIQGLMVHFRPVSLSNMTGEFDSHATAIEYTDREIGAGNLDYDGREPRIIKIEKRLDDFVQNHPDYKRIGGLGLMWPEKTDQERVDELAASIQASQDKLKEMKKSLDKGEEGAIEEIAKELSPGIGKDPEELVKPVGVTRGTAPSRQSRGPKADMR